MILDLIASSSTQGLAVNRGARPPIELLVASTAPTRESACGDSGPRRDLFTRILQSEKSAEDREYALDFAVHFVALVEAAWVNHFSGR